VEGSGVKLRIRGATPSEERIEARKRGDILHRALSFVRTAEDRGNLELLVKRAVVLEGESLRAWNIPELVKDLEKVLDSSELEWIFSGEAEVFTEQEILWPEGEVRVVIPDRVLRFEDRIVVVDYKSSRPENEQVLQGYREQVRFYTKVVGKAFRAPTVEGYLLFLTPEPSLERVNP